MHVWVCEKLENIVLALLLDGVFLGRRFFFFFSFFLHAANISLRICCRFETSKYVRLSVSALFSVYLNTYIYIYGDYMYSFTQ